MPAIAGFLSTLASAGPDWATLALLSARDVALQRPPARPAALQVVLEAAAGADEDLRSKAVRLLVNRLLPEASMSGRIEQFARQSLARLAARPAAEAGAVEPDVSGPTGSAAAAEAAAEAAAQGMPSRPSEEGDLPVAQPSAAPAVPELPTEPEAARACALYCALCTKRPTLLRGLFEAYTATSGEDQPGCTEAGMQL